MCAFKSWHQKLFIAVAAEGASIKCMYVCSSVVSISIDVMDRTTSQRRNLTLIYVGVHCVLDSKCKLEISPHSNCGCESMLLINPQIVNTFYHPLPKSLILCPGVDPGFFIGECAPLKNDKSDWQGKKILKENTKKAASFQRGAHPLHPPRRYAPDALSVSKPWLINSPCKTCFQLGQIQHRENTINFHLNTRHDVDNI